MTKYEIAANDLAKKYRVKVVYIPKGYDGQCNIPSRTIRTQRPTDPYSFAGFAHEIGHIKHGKGRLTALAEIKAENFMRAACSHYRIPLSRRHIVTQQSAILALLAFHLNHGLKSVPKELTGYYRHLTKVNGKWVYKR